MVDFVPLNKDYQVTFLMRSHQTRSTRDRSKYPTQLAKMSFDEILDLTADVFFYFFIFNNTCVHVFKAAGLAIKYAIRQRANSVRVIRVARHAVSLTQGFQAGRDWSEVHSHRTRWHVIN